MMRVVFVISILFGVVVARGQQPARNIIAEADKTGIIESVLDLERRNQSSIADFANIRDVSSANIEFIEPSRLSTHGFRVVSVASLNAAKQDHVVEYLLFKTISLRDGVAIVVLSRVTEGRPCFGEPFSRERRSTYKARRTPVGWIAEVIARPASPISFTRTRSALWR
jgi:hypothetical protein